MLTFTYDITLVAAALCVSMIAAFTGLTLTQGLSALPHTQRKVFVSMAALALGGGIWSTHFIAMLALQLPVDIGYDPLFTLASVMFAVLLVGVALLLMHFSQRNRRNIIISGVLIGAGIVSMHFVGMLGIRGCIPQFEDMGKLVSSLVAVAMGVAAIQISYGRRTQGSIVFGTIVFGLSVVLTHFAAMYWTGFARLPQAIFEAGQKGVSLQRYKGLGEMNAEQLWETTLDPDARTFLQVKINEASEADDLFSRLMGEEVEPRRQFIQTNALNVANLDF